MKLKHPIPGMQALLPGTLMLILTTFLFACNKHKDALSFDNDMGMAAKAISGQLMQGRVSTLSDTEGMLLQINDLFIIVQQTPGNKLAELPEMSSAALITSEYGLILKDLVRGEVYLLVNNDEESVKQFRSIASVFASAVSNDLIFGTMIIKAPNS